MRKTLTPEARACLERARRMICGDKGRLSVEDDGTLFVDGHPGKLEPSRDPIDALIVITAKAMELHLSGVDFGKLREKFVAIDTGEGFADSVYDHLVNLSDNEWVHVRTRVDFYVDDNARRATYDTDKSGAS